VAQGKDIVIIEGTPEQFRASRDIVTALNAKVLVVEVYSKELLKATDNYKQFGQSLLGVVLNKVPKTRMEETQNEASARLGKAGVNLLGVIPEDRTLLALTIGELAEYIHGEFLSGAGQSAELAENLMLGALGLDPGPEYFGRKANKAVILKSERPDMQLAALQTSSRCLVLAGSTPPDPMVIRDAEARNTPIIIAKDNVTALVTNIEDALVKTRFNQTNKLPRLVEIMNQHLDFQKLYQGLGVAS
jgi:BioD-like phosphotransacetylase family protein